MGVSHRFSVTSTRERRNPQEVTAPTCGEAVLASATLLAKGAGPKTEGRPDAASKRKKPDEGRWAGCKLVTAGLALVGGTLATWGAPM